MIRFSLLTSINISFMKNYYLLFLFLLTSSLIWSQELNPFNDNVESNADFTQTNLNGWTSLDLDGLNTAGSFHEFPGKGGPLGFIVYTPSETDPVNDFDEYAPRSGKKYFASISSYDGHVNDWLISDELAEHPGGTFSFYAKSSFDFMGVDEFKVAYSTTTAEPENFIFLNGGNTMTTSTNWRKFEFEIPSDAKHIAINGVSQAVMLMIDDLQFSHSIDDAAPGLITNFEVSVEMNAGVEAHFSWTNPIIDAEGNALNELTGIKIFRGTNPMNLQEIADLSSTPGQVMTYIDELPEEGNYIHRFVGYNSTGNGELFDTPLTYFGLETIPGAPRNISFSQNQNLQTVISWDVVDYGQDGGTLQDPVTGYTIIRSLGNTSETLATMQPETTFTETDIPDFNLYTYSIIAHIDSENYGEPGVAAYHSGMNENGVSITRGTIESEQVFELNRTSIISQSIYTPEEIGETGLITSVSYSGNLGTGSVSHYKIYASTTNRDVFGTTLNNAVWEYYGDQKLIFDGEINFPAGRNGITIELDQPFYYDAASGENVIISIVKPLDENPPIVNPANFLNTSVEGLRTYYAIGYSVDLSTITTQPAAWSTEEVPTIPSIAVEKTTDYGNISGEVTVTGGGAPLENVLITITPNDSNSYQTETTTTDEDGSYLFPAVLPGDYLVTFTKDGYNTIEEEITVEPEEGYVLNVEMEEAVSILISGRVINDAGLGIEGVTLNLTGFSNFTAQSDASGNFTLEAYGEKEYDLEYFHPLYDSETISFTSEEQNFTLTDMTLNLSLHKPGSVVAVNNEGVGEVSWRIPVGHYEETTIGWGTFIAAGDAWGNGNNPFIAGVRFEPADLENQISEGAELTHVKAYIANYAEIVVHVYEGQNAENTVHSQAVSIPEEGWYEFELSSSIPIDMNDELWIGIEFIGGQYGSYPIGLDDGPNAPNRKGSMLYENGVWTGMSLTNKNWNIYGITNQTMDADPIGYRVYRSVASINDWTELTSEIITETSFEDSLLQDQDPGLYEYGITAEYESDLSSEKAISNGIEHLVSFDFTIEVTPDHGSPEGAYVSIQNEDNFAEAFISGGNSAVFSNLPRGTYTVRVELDNYGIEVLEDVEVDDSATLVIPLSLLKIKPKNFTADQMIPGGVSYYLEWTLQEAYTDEMEKYADFEKEEIGDYILRDMDGLSTYTYINFTFPGAGDPMAYMIFNPLSTTPPVSIDAYSGQKFLAGFAGPDGPNDDWLIIQAKSGDFSFKAASLEVSALEQMRVLYSTSGIQPSDFTPFESTITVPNYWENYSFEAPEETKYIAINYVSNDSYILKIDDLTYEKEYFHELYYNIYLNDDLFADNITEPNFILDIPAPGYYVVEVEAVYETGVSERAEIILGYLDIDDYPAFDFMIYPNPSKGTFNIELNANAEITIFDIQGRTLYNGTKKAGISVMQQDLSSGTYIVQVKTDDGIATKKLIIE